MDLKYRGEGSAAMVFALPKSNEVLRLIKSNTIEKIRKDIGAEDMDGSNMQTIQKAIKEQLINVMDYMRNVMQPLFSNQFVVAPTLAKVPLGFANKALALTRHERPVHRKKSGDNSLDADIEWAFVLPDCCFVHHKNINCSMIDSGVLENNSDLSILLESICETDLDLIDRKENPDSTHSPESIPKFCDDSSAPTSKDFLPTSQRKITQDISSDSSRCQSTQNSNIPNGHNTRDGADLNVMVGKSRIVTSKGKFGDISASSLSSHEDNLMDSCSESVDFNNQRDFTLSFEIKPKKAFMISKATGKTGRAQVCKFCMHQCLKFKDGKFKEISEYCPIDLFSGDRERIKYSLHGLIKAPQHQLKICKNGKEVYGSEIRQDLSEILKDWFPEHTNCSDELLSKFLDLIIEVLLYSTKDNATIPAQKYSESHEISGRERRQMGAEGSDRDSVVGRVEPEPTRLVSNGQGGGQICGKSPFFSSSKARDTENKMPSGCVLECMSRLQQMDQLDIEDIYHLHSSLATKMMADPDLRKKWKWDGPFTDISWILRENYEAHQDAADMCGNPVEEDVLKVKRFLVSKTLQDCSIIVAIKPVSGGRGSQRDDHCLSFHGVLYEFAVRIIDLDSKSFDKVPFYYYQAVDIVSAFEDLMH